jgi:hypothetical protein
LKILVTLSNKYYVVSRFSKFKNNLEKSRALDLHNIMRGLKVNADPSICFKFLKAMEIYTVKGLKFDLMDASVILVKKDQLYGKD